MAKLTGPLLSIGARGQIGKTMVTSSWKGINYARQYTIPANPRTSAQTATRSVFAWLSNAYRMMGSLALAPWSAAVVGRPLTPRNKLFQENIPLLRGEADIANFSGSSGAHSGLPANTMTASDDTGQVIEVVFDNPEAPTGWTLQSVVAVALIDQDPSGGFTGTFVEGEEDTTPWTTVSLDVGVPGDYMVTGWPTWEKPDGTIAYGAALTDTVTVA